MIAYHKLGQGVMEVKGFNEKLEVGQGKVYSLEEWNPLLIAIAYKKTDIVRYLVEDQKVSLRLFGASP